MISEHTSAETRKSIVHLRDVVELVLSLRRVGLHDRTVITRALRSVIEQHEEYLGLWCVFESNAFDGNDAAYVGEQGHDAAGRFAPRWHRNAGTLQLGCSQGHDHPLLGEWYMIARESRQEVVFGPYDEQPLTGLPVLCLSRVAPILERGRFIGAVGVDVSVDAMARQSADAIDSLEEMLGRSHIFVGEDLAIQAMSRRAKMLLARYVDARRGKTLPPQLQEAVANGATGWRGKFAGRTGSLHVSLVRHPHSARSILSLEEVLPAGTLAPEGVTISTREQEVLEWLCAGKSNPEIALILEISEHTVRHHLERIFSKLGVENRHAAMRCVERTAQVAAPRVLSRAPAALLHGGMEPASSGPR